MAKTQLTLLYRQDFSSIPENIPKLPCKCEVLDPVDLSRIADIRSLSTNKIAQFRRRFERGDCCFIASHNEQAVHYAWVQTSGRHPIHPAKRSWTVKSREAWIYDCRTSDWARGNSVYPFILTNILINLRSQDYSCAWIYTTKQNIASQRGIMKAGFRLTYKLFCLELAGKVLRLPPIPV